MVELLLGHGGFSVVYRARHVELGNVVALKEYLPAGIAVRSEGSVYPRSTENTLDYEDGRRRFLEEARHIVELKNEPGVVTCLGFFRANGTAYIVLELVEGMSLAELLARRESAGKSLNENELRLLMFPLLKTLARLHKADVLHRDIKPSNILVRRTDGAPILIDFGSAKQDAALHSKSNAPFTREYAAFEQIGKGDLGPWTDIYAIGAVMWRVVAGGNPPWDPPVPKGAALRANAVLEGKRDPLPSAVDLGHGRFSPELLKAIDQCLMILAADRISDAEELNRILNNRQSPTVLDPADDSSSRIASTSSTRRKSMPGLAWCIAVGLLVGTGYCVLHTEREWSNGAGLTVTTVPSGASIAIENVSRAYSPGMLLPPAVYRVAVSAPGFQTRTVLVDHLDSPSTIHVALIRTPVQSTPEPILKTEKRTVKQARLTIWPEPNYADIVLLGSPIPYKSGMILALGSYTIEVSADGYHSRRVLIEHSGPRPHRIKMENIVHPLVIDVHPRDATIELIGVKSVYSPGMLLPLKLYRARISAPGYRSTIVQIHHSDPPSKTRINLEPLPSIPKPTLSTQSASFIVNTEPSDATVILLNNTREYQRAMQLELGVHKIEVSASGFVTTKVTVNHRGASPHIVKLNRQTAPLTVNTIPQNAQTELVNSSFKFKDKVQLPPGRYLVRVSAPSYESRTLVIDHGHEPTVERVVLDRSIYLDVGLDQDQVIALHGRPSVVTRHGPKEYEIWHYDASTVTIDSQSRAVVTWKNAGNLKIRPSSRPQIGGPSYIKVGSDAADVVRLHGSPTATVRSGGGPETWRYGSSVVVINPQTKRVVAIRNSGDLKTDP